MLVSDLKIVVCSRSRATKLITKNLFVGFKLYVVVPESQLEDYKKHNPEPNLEIIAQPNWVRGIGDCRYWVMTNFGDCFMLDDDVESLRNYSVVGEGPEIIRNSEHVNDVIQNLYFTAKNFNAKMFGFGSIKSKLDFVSQKPFRLTGYISVSNCGYMADHGLHYDIEESWLNTCEGYYFSALNTHKNRFCFVDERYTAYTLPNTSGGCSDYRKSSDTEHCITQLMKMFGSAIAAKNPRKKTDKSGRSIVLKVPF